MSALPLLPIFWRNYLGAMLAISLMVASSLIFVCWIELGGSAVEEHLQIFDRTRSIASFKEKLGENDNGKLNAKGLFLDSGTEGGISAKLLANLKQIAVTRGLEVLQIQDLPPKTEAALLEFGADFEVSGSSAALYGFVQDIEAANPLMFIEKMRIQSQGFEPQGQMTENPIHANLEIFGTVPSMPKKATP